MSATHETQQVLSFRLAGGDYAVAILQVKEILQYAPLTEVPGLARSVRGVMNVRGAVVPVVDLALRMGLPPTQVTRFTCVLVVETEARGETVTLGVMADGVSAVVDLVPGQIEAPPTFGAAIDARFLMGVARGEKGFLLLLDLDRVLSDEADQQASRREASRAA
jgi:chemotaxis signal transduction protein